MSVKIRDRIRTLVGVASTLEERITHIADTLFGEAPAKADGSKSSAAPCPDIISETHFSINCLEDRLGQVFLQLDRLATLTQQNTLPPTEAPPRSLDKMAQDFRRGEPFTRF